MLKAKIFKYLSYFVILFTALFITIGLTRIPFFINLEDKIHDYFFSVRNSTKPMRIPENIIIIAIDEPSFQELKESWPWPRHIHAKLINNLLESEAEIIGFDIVFADPSHTAEDNSFANTIKKAGNVILASSLDISENKLIIRESTIEPLENFKSASLGVGLANVFTDKDNFVRRMSLKINEKPVFSYLIAENYLLRRDPSSDLGIDNPNNPIIINYAGPPGTIRTVSYYQALDNKKYLPQDIFKNKIVLIGMHLEATPYTTTKSLDTFATPFFSSSPVRMSGIEVHANIINTLLSKIQIIKPDITQNIILLIILLFLSSLVILPLKPIKGLLTALIFIFIYISTAGFVFTLYRILLPVIYPSLQAIFVLIAIILYKYFVVEKISIYDPLTELLNRGNLELQLEKNIHNAHGNNRDLAVVMTDIDHFKNVNDAYGHQAGDYVLQTVSHLLRKHLKGHDIIGRYGGEEFCIIMPRTSVTDAETVIEKLRKIIAHTKLETGPDYITMSFGIAGIKKEDDKKTIIKRADNALYKAKETGRNRTVAG